MVALYLFLKGMTGALAPFSYLVTNVYDIDNMTYIGASFSHLALLIESYLYSLPQSILFHSFELNVATHHVTPRHIT